MTYTQAEEELKKAQAAALPAMQTSALAAPTAPTTELTATYIDQAGNRQTGVYEAAAEALEAEKGDLSYWEKLGQSYQKIYEDQVAANNAAAASAAQRAAENIQAQIDALRTQYQGVNKQLYRDYREQERVLPQQLAAQGYSGGLSESSRLRLGTSYEEALQQNEAARLAGETQLNATGAQAQYEARAAADQANLAALQQLNQYQLALEQGRYEQEQTQMQARAETLAAMGDFSGYLGLGYSQDEVDYLTRLWLAENPGLKTLWTQAHPEEAERLGLVQRVSANRYYAPDDEEAAILAEIEEMRAAGYNDISILNTINRKKHDGKITADQATAYGKAVVSTSNQIRNGMVTGIPER